LFREETGKRRKNLRLERKIGYQTFISSSGAPQLQPMQSIRRKGITGGKIPKGKGDVFREEEVGTHQVCASTSRPEERRASSA